MLFKNLRLYRLPRPWLTTPTELEDQLRQRPFVKCGTLTARSEGWVPPCPTGNPDAYVVTTPDLTHWHIRLKVQEKTVPARVVKAEAARRAVEIEKVQCYKPGKRQMKAIEEEVCVALLPRAFATDRHIDAWIDPHNGWLGIDTASTGQAERILDALRGALEEFPVRMLKVNRSPASLMAGWLATEPEAPFTIDQDCVLKAVTDDKATIRYAHYSLDGKDVQEHLSTGKLPTRLAMTWDDRISFVIDEAGTLRRLHWLSIIMERVEQDAGTIDNPIERHQADLTIMGTELARLLADLVDNLGGEKAEEDAPIEPRATRPHRHTQAANNLHLPRDDNADPLYPAAVQIVGKERRASASLVQRHLTIGYNRAARLVQRMEDDGYVSPMDTSGTRTLTAKFPRAALWTLWLP